MTGMCIGIMAIVLAKKPHDSGYATSFIFNLIYSHFDTQDIKILMY